MQNNFHVRTHYLNIYDFSEFSGNNPPLSDCTLILDGNLIRSHVMILANNSEFFFNAFTSGMAEDVKREVSIAFNPLNLFSKVVQWFYTAQIDVTQNEIMALFAITRFYGINKLYKDIDEYLKINLTESNIFDFIAQCYDNELSAELHYLVPHIANLIEKLKLSELSENLDVQIFCDVLNNLEEQPKTKMELLTKFIGSYVCTEEDTKSISKLFDTKNMMVRAAYKELKPKWAPAGSF